nr:immunoglobulin heavy chain junction region [Mus musculus]MBK4188036.1 immunoglobulin heavy chain junction region [Mus musculus]
CARSNYVGYFDVW